MTLDHVVPQAGDLMFHPDTSPENGIAVYDGYNYLVRFDMHESDGGWSNIEPMGWVLHVLNTGEHGLGLGTHTARSVLANRTGDFTITYEIRPTPLPDLQALHQITIDDLPGSAKKRVCMVVHNRGGAPAGPFEVALRVDHVVPPDGRTTAAGLAPGMNYTACVETALPTPGQHLLAAVVDAPRAVTELNETNNSYEQLYAAASASSSTAPAPSPQSAPATGQAQSDLTVSAVKVRGQVPDGKDDCKDGGNDVSVVVKNSGSEKAGGFTVRLTVDGAQGDGSEQTVNGLEAGNEREVTFENVKLKKGEHSLKALADAKGAVTETNEENNDREVTARCKDEN
ncbi:MAG TPA: CARDB domain-containing protein [Chloroflexota bacterium]|nr:CARDB domain-containing protein [Chloroflexota bacterium]